MLEWARAFAPMPVAQLLLTAQDIQQRERYVNAKNALEASLKLGAMPIINENDSVTTNEIRFGDNDSLSAWVAHLMGADALILLTDVDGLFDSDPRFNKHAKVIKDVHNIADVKHLAGHAGTQRGTGGMVTKLRAAELATVAGTETLIIGGGGPGLEALAKGEIRGTRFYAKTSPSARKSWLAQLPLRGSIEIDAGAAKALSRGNSLLPKGITVIDGHFDFGDAVAVTHNGACVARGLSNYPSAALKKIIGLHTSAIADILGYKDYDEAVHRDNLVLIAANRVIATKEQ